MTPKQVQKKKKREREVKEKIGLRRERKAKSLKDQADWEAKQLRESGYGESKTTQPFRKDTISKQSAEEVRERLEHNLKVLKVLEDEYKKEKGGDLMDEIKKSQIGKVSAVAEAAEHTEIN